MFGRKNQLSKYRADYGFSMDLDDALEECLSSQKPFFRQKSGGRGSRSGGDNEAKAVAL